MIRMTRKRKMMMMMMAPPLLLVLSLFVMDPCEGFHAPRVLHTHHQRQQQRQDGRLQRQADQQPSSWIAISSLRRTTTTTTATTPRNSLPSSSKLAATTSSSSSSLLDDKGPSNEELTNEEISRYSRHLVLSDVGMAGQKALKNASVLVVGAGGLGSPCLLYLAAAGVGRIGIVDADTVDASNLQRQIVHGTSTVGVSKCESAERRILDINPTIRTRLYKEEFTADTAMRILGNGFDTDNENGDGVPYDIVIDGSDNFPTKYLINDVCDILGVTWVYSAILAFEGQLSVFNLDGKGPTYRDLLPVPPPPGNVPSCAEGGVLGVLPGTMGCLQATEAIKYILGRKDGLCSGRVLVFDAMQMRFSEHGLAKQPDREEITELIDYQGFCAGPKTLTPTPAKSSSDTPSSGRTMDEAESDDDTDASSSGPAFHAIEPKDCLDKLLSGWSPWVLDVRLQTENDIVALPFTDRVSPHRTVRITDIPESGDVLVYCKAGVRGKKACNRLVEQGVDPERLYNLEGGIMKWRNEVDSSMPRY